MKKRNEARRGYGKLLDAWVKPDTAGDPVGCVATSFTFSHAFFEEECLSRFLGLQSDPGEDGPVYIIEREEKLAGATCAALVDQHHCAGSRSLRWDLLPVRPERGILHAKISLLCWSRLVRLIVSSANVTEDGYRRNQEIYGVLDYEEGQTAPVACLRETTQFLQNVVTGLVVVGEAESPSVKRVLGFLADVGKRVRQTWKVADSNGGRGGIKVWPVLVGPGRKSLLQQVKDLWPDGSPPRDAYVTSPFFDASPANRPAQEIWEVLSQKGRASVTYNVRVQEEAPGSGSWYVCAPETLRLSKPSNRRQASVNFAKLKERDEGSEGAFRPVHLKSMWLENDGTVTFVVGSSNFTSAGLGLSNSANLEANLAYVASAGATSDLYRSLEAAYVGEEELDINELTRWMPTAGEGEDSASPDTVVLPPCFGDAVYGTKDGRDAFVGLSLHSTPPEGWSLVPDNGSGVFLDEDTWHRMGSPTGTVTIPWTASQPPSGFEVRWKGSQGAAWWPVTVTDPFSLPPPDELKDLPLETLIHILTSARPLHELIRAARKRSKPEDNSSGGVLPVIDPLKRVDTTSFLLQRTRRVSWALAELGKRLRRPVPTVETLQWRLHGPVGVMALAQAIKKEAKSEQEQAFLLTELVVELARVKPDTLPGCISAETVKSEIRKVIEELRSGISLEPLEEFPEIKAYVLDVLQEVAQ